MIANELGEIVDPDYFNKLGSDDKSDFQNYYGTNDEDLLIAGSKTLNRLRKYLPGNEFNRIQIILSALHNDFGIPSNRLLSANALEIYLTYMIPESEEDNLSSKIAKLELELLEANFTGEEKKAYSQNRKVAIGQWPVYIKDPLNI